MLEAFQYWPEFWLNESQYKTSAFIPCRVMLTKKGADRVQAFE